MTGRSHPTSFRRRFRPDIFGCLAVLALGLAGCTNDKEIHIIVEVRSASDKEILVELNGKPNGVAVNGRRDIFMRAREGEPLTVAVTQDSVKYAKFVVDARDQYPITFRYGSAPAIELSARPELTATSSVVFPASNSLERQEMDVALHNSGGQTLLIESLSVTGGNAGDFRLQEKGPLELAPDAQYDLKVRFHPSVRGKRAASLSIVSNDPQNPTFSIDLTGGDGVVVKSAPSIVVQESVDFEGTPLVDEKILDIPVKNAGNARLRVQSMNLSGPNAAAFHLKDPQRFDVASGSHASIRIGFYPLSQGPHTASLQIISNDADNGSVVVRLMGEGKEEAGGSTSPDEILQNSIAAYGRNDYDASENDATRILIKNPYDPDAFYLRGMSRFCQGKYEEAIRDLAEFYTYRTNMRNRKRIDELSCASLYYKAFAATKRYQGSPQGDQNAERNKALAIRFLRDFLDLSLCAHEEKYRENASTMLNQLTGE